MTQILSDLLVTSKNMSGCTIDLVQLVLCLKHLACDASTKRGIPLPAIIEVAVYLGLCWRRANGRLIHFPGKEQLNVMRARFSSTRFIPHTNTYCKNRLIAHTTSGEMVSASTSEFDLASVIGLPGPLVKVTRFHNWHLKCVEECITSACNCRMYRSIRPDGRIFDIYTMYNHRYNTSNTWYCIESDSKQPSVGPVWKRLGFERYTNEISTWIWDGYFKDNDMIMICWAEGALPNCQLFQ